VTGRLRHRGRPATRRTVTHGSTRKTVIQPGTPTRGVVNGPPWPPLRLCRGTPRARPEALPRLSVRRGLLQPKSGLERSGHRRGDADAGCAEELFWCAIPAGTPTFSTALKRENTYTTAFGRPRVDTALSSRGSEEVGSECEGWTCTRVSRSKSRGQLHPRLQVRLRAAYVLLFGARGGRAAGNEGILTFGVAVVSNGNPLARQR